MTGGFASGSARSVGNIFWQRASGMNCAATSAEKHRRFKTSGNLTKGQEKITMTCFIKMNARTGATKINRVKNTAGFPADRLEKIQAAFSDFKKEALQRKKAVKTGTASPKEFTDWLYQQSNVIVELTEI